MEKMCDAIICNDLTEHWIKTDNNNNNNENKPDIIEIIKFNRSTLNMVPKWIDKTTWDIPQSIFNYGLPAHIFHLIDLPISHDITESDMICKLLIDLLNFNNSINYLEIGVSVGKTFFQIIKFAETHLKHATVSLSCLDIEKMNPILENLINPNNKEVITIPTNVTKSIRSNNLNVITKMDNITYYESDEFDSDIWKNMGKYNFIFSDALHDPSALIYEYNMLKQHNLLDENGFMYCFDDLESIQTQPMWKAVHYIANDIITKFSNCTVTIDHLVINGWIGQHESPHNFGIIKVIPKYVDHIFTE